MSTTCYPSLYQINTRVWLDELSPLVGRRAMLDDIPDAELDRLSQQGFDWIWFLSVWQTGTEARQVSRSQPEWRQEFQETLSDLREEDIVGSGFAITGYTVHEDLGGDSALARLRDRLRARGLKLMLDFVPNHVGLGHPWVKQHPDYFIAGTEADLAREPQNFVRVPGSSGSLILAFGRDPNFAGWPDTLQLDYSNRAVPAAMMGELSRIASQCDGVRCDMAMLLLPDVFTRTWGRQMSDFWPEAMERVHQQVPSFLFLAEAYWDLEWTLQQQGFDYTYDKRLYDRLREGRTRPVREHLLAGVDYQRKLARFLENHDEPRAATVFPSEVQEAAAVITYLSPGLRFFHQGQFEGRRKRISPHLGRGPVEPVESRIQQFYDRLLTVLRQPMLRTGDWQLLNCRPAWESNWTHDEFVAFVWQGDNGERLLVAVNYAPHQSQCRVDLPWGNLGGTSWRLQDQLSADHYDRAGDELQSQGLFLDLGPWQASVFTFREKPTFP